MFKLFLARLFQHFDNLFGNPIVYTNVIIQESNYDVFWLDF
jgi:hypothetical protein